MRMNNLSFNPGYTLNEYNYLPFYAKHTTYLEYADLVMNGVMAHHNTFKMFEKYDPYNIDWNMEFKEANPTQQMFLHALNTVSLLSIAFNNNQQTEYMIMATKIILSWLKYDQTIHKNNMVWNDHCTALRLENLIYYLLAINTAKDDKILDKAIEYKIISLCKKHVRKLLNDSFYTRNHNHGIYQDRSLIYWAYFIDDGSKEKILRIAKKRLEEQKKFIFNSEMVSRENSTGYHVGTITMFHYIASFLMSVEDLDSLSFSSDIYKGNKFTIYATKPNTGLAEIGDTYSIPEGKISGIGYKYNDDELLYATTLGTKGITPQKRSMAFPQSGYYFYRHSWEKACFMNSTWFMLKSGYSSKTHKHADDLSFMLFSRGYDIFVDSGCYIYHNGNKYRDYLISSLAHNTIVVDDKSYSFMAEESYKTGLCRLQAGDEYTIDTVTAYNNMYMGVEISRTVYNFKNEMFLIYDDIYSKDEHNYKQLFHCSEYTDIIEANKNEVTLSIKDSNSIVRIKQLNLGCSLDILRGDDGQNKYGYISRNTSHIQPINVLSFAQVSRSAQYVTLITIEDDGPREYTYIDNEFYLNDMPLEKICIYAKERMDFNVKVTQCNNSFEFTQQKGECDNNNFLWYIMDRKGKVITKSDWSSDPSYKFTCGNIGEFVVRLYIKYPSGIRKFSNVAHIHRNKKSFTVLSDENKLNYAINNLVISQKGPDHLFKVETEYVLNTDYKWYIYKDGIYYKTITTSKPTLKYQFNEIGKYTISFYVNSNHCTTQYWQFDMVEIDKV